MDNLRQCRCCKELFPLDEFYNLAKGPGGKHPNCITCCKVNRALEFVRKRDKSSKISVRQRVRAIGLGVVVDPEVKLVEVYRRARGICYLCNKWVKPGDASMDHILALTNGGSHTYDNLKLTHLKCNLQKGAKYII